MRAWSAESVQVQLEALPDAPDQAEGSTDLGLLGDGAFGVWEITPGSSTGVEVDEVSVVLSGRGRVEDLDTGDVLGLAPGTVLRLTAGRRTRWTIEETVRKVYVLG